MNRIKYALSIFLIALTCNGCAMAQEQQERELPYQQIYTYPMGTPPIFPDTHPHYFLTIRDNETGEIYTTGEITEKDTTEEFVAGKRATFKLAQLPEVYYRPGTAYIVLNDGDRDIGFDFPFGTNYTRAYGYVDITVCCVICPDCRCVKEERVEEDNLL